MPDPQRMSDHDLLIDIHRQVNTVVDRVQDHEKRIRHTERILYVGIGLAAALGSGVGSLASRFVV